MRQLRRRAPPSVPNSGESKAGTEVQTRGPKYRSLRPLGLSPSRWEAIWRRITEAAMTGVAVIGDAVKTRPRLIDPRQRFSARFRCGLGLFSFRFVARLNGTGENVSTGHFEIHHDEGTNFPVDSRTRNVPRDAHLDFLFQSTSCFVHDRHNVSFQSERFKTRGSRTAARIKTGLLQTPYWRSCRTIRGSPNIPDRQRERTAPGPPGARR